VFWRGVWLGLCEFDSLLRGSFFGMRLGEGKGMLTVLGWA
jgi:hypothetical protein